LSSFFEDVRPTEGEIVLPKTCSSFFTGTAIDRILRNIGIENVIIVGFYTEQCITTTARDAADTGYYVYVVNDAVAATTVEVHDAALRAIEDRYAKILSTDKILDKISSLE
jgi:nicotinamidase-related amidase